MNTKNTIAYVTLVLDESGSMNAHRQSVIKVVDNLIKWLAERSQQLDQETRVSLYTFSKSDCKRLVFDKDVLRLPSIKDIYHPNGGTPLIDATYQSQLDLQVVARAYRELYGADAEIPVLTFVVTDGEENTSTKYVPAQPPWGTNRPWDKGALLRNLIADQDPSWTMACLVPNSRGKLDAQSFGFPAGNIEIWDTTSQRGVEEVGEKIQAATDTYLTNVSTGNTRGTNTLFAPTKQQVQAAGLKPLNTDDYLLLTVIPTKGIDITIPKKTVLKSRPDGIKHVEIQAFIEAQGRTYETGKTFYEVVKREKIDGNKKIIVVENATGLAYTGAEARKLVGLDQYSRSVKPVPKDKAGNREFSIFVQSTSTNRLLSIHDSRVLVLTK
jgi:hypothetical protein